MEAQERRKLREKVKERVGKCHEKWRRYNKADD